MCQGWGSEGKKKFKTFTIFPFVYLWKNIYSVPLFVFQKETLSGRVLFVEYIHTNKTGKKCPNLAFFQEKSV